MLPRVAAFTDTYLPTINGVTYTIESWRDRWRERGGRMQIVYPQGDHEPDDGEYPVRSFPFPFYDGYRLGVPRIPDAVDGAAVVHSHTPFSVGFAGYRFARRTDRPLVVSYHTPTAEYARYVAPGDHAAAALRRASERYERWFLNRADVVVTPTESTATHVRENVGVETPVEVVSNGVDVDRFRPVDATAFRERHGLDADRPLVGYTGRHGYEKRLHEIVEAVADLDVTVVFGGDGPARGDLEKLASDRGVDARFLGFLDRAELPAFYSALDVFAFPSPIETQGLVALEANACGTPVVAANSGALATTVVDGETGYHFESGDVAAFREALARAIERRATLSEACLDSRDGIAIGRTIDRLAAVYDRVGALAPA